MRLVTFAFSVATAMASTMALAQPAPATSTPATAPASAAAPAHYTTADTDIGTLLDDPAAKAILFKYIPLMAKSDQIDMARSMTLKQIQQYSPDTITDKVLTDMDAEFAALPPKK